MPSAHFEKLYKNLPNSIRDIIDEHLYERYHKKIYKTCMYELKYTIAQKNYEKTILKILHLMENQ